MLMQKRTMTDPMGKPIRYPEAWVFPGGRIETGETPQGCVRREVPEEFGISIEGLPTHHLMTYTHDGTDVDAVYFIDVSHIPQGDFVLKEGARMAWHTLQEIGALDLGFEQEKIVPVLAAHISMTRS